jgi:uncharacterized protein
VERTAAPRHERIDTLRGIAVFGILTVNVWGLATGSQLLRYGVLDAAAGDAERIAIALVAAFAEVKFYPIFAFLFGAGFALQMRALVRSTGGVNQARWFYRRRLKWLLGCGLLHGLLLWYGDILNSYALAGYWLLGTAGRRLRVLRRQFISALVLTLALMVIGMVAIGAVGEPSVETMNEALYDLERARVVFGEGGFLVAAVARAKAFGTNLLGLPFFLPELVTLFLAGVFAVRLGWLTRPERHRPLWQRVQLAGFGIGLPINLYWAWLAVAEAQAPQAMSVRAAVGHGLLTVGGTLLAAAYVATLMLASERTARCAAWLFAPVGRMALSNYLMQSLLGVVMLQGVGLGLATTLSRPGLLAWCGCVMVVQVALSRWWLSFNAQGPIEAIWRRYTYRA